MALSILDGNQSATTLSTILSSGQHITAHTVVSLGTQAITDVRSAVSGSVVSISNFPATQSISGTVTANVVGFNPTPNETFGTGVIQSITDSEKDTIRSSLWIADSSASNGSATEGQILSQNYPMPIYGTVTIGSAVFSKSTGSVSMPTQAVLLGFGYDSNQNFVGVNDEAPLPVQIYSALPDGTNRIGVVTIGGGTVTIGAGTAQIGSVTASISGTVPVSISSVTVGNSITIGSCVTHGVTIANTSVTVNGTFFQATQPVSLASLPALAAGTAQIGSVTASISGTVPVSGTFYQATQPVSLTTLPALVAGTSQIGSVTASISNSVVTFYPMQGTSVSNTNFTSTTASTTLVSAVANREVLTVFNEGAGNLHISPGATCTTVAYQVRLSAGDYWECPQGQLSIAHTAVFATAGTARVTQVS